MTRLDDQAAGRWFKRVLWIGIAGNFALAVPTLIAPGRMLALSGFPNASPLLWPQFAGLLLVLLSVFYMPAGVDLERFRAIAWLAVAARLAGVVFFIGFQPAAYRMLGYFDFVFFVPELVLLIAAIRQPSAAAGRLPAEASR
jgi:uncharacterized membrane protein